MELKGVIHLSVLKNVLCVKQNNNVFNINLEKYNIKVLITNI